MKETGKAPWPIRWRQGLGHWLSRHDLLTGTLVHWLQRGIARADFRRWGRHLD